MSRAFSNAYDDANRAQAYSRLEFPATYYLAYRDLPEIIGEHVRGRQALDFGCGAGRSTRFLRELGFAVVGVDISREMVNAARGLDPAGDYRLLPDGDLSALTPGAFDLVTCIFTFDNVPTMQRKVSILRGLGNLLAPEGRIVALVSRPETYAREWASFSTKDFPENRTAKMGDVVRVIVLDMEDQRPVEDILWPDQAYREAFRRAGLAPLARYRPLGKTSEPYEWVSETEFAPWSIYVLEREPR